MARQETGWVKLHRKVLDSDIGKNYLLLGLWLTLIRWANWTDSKINWRGTPRILGRGELLTSIEELASYGEANRKTVMKWISYLEKRESISVDKSPRGSRSGMIIKVKNYEKYQAIEAIYGHEHGNEPGHEHGQDRDMSMDTYKGLKNIRIKEYKNKSVELPRLAVLWNEHSGQLSKVLKSNANRNKRAATRLSEHPEGEWVNIIKRIANSHFCNGKNESGWKATFDWILQPDTALKTIEGKYDNRGPKSFANERQFNADDEIMQLMSEASSGT